VHEPVTRERASDTSPLRRAPRRRRDALVGPAL